MESVTDKATKIWMALMNFGEKMGCHQMAERSFFFRGYQFPVCARCIGVFAGEIIAIVMLLCGVEIPWVPAFLLVLPLAIDGGVQYIKLWLSNNLRRVITGVLAGIGLTYIYYYAIRFLIKSIVQVFCS